MNSSIKISVIVPIYNVEEYLRECLESLVNQTIKDIEVIMIDDGSTDNSSYIAQEYSEKYNNFYYKRKVNGGLGAARNYGVKYSKGEYIAFVDSDDILSENAYQNMYNKAVKNNSDIVIGNVRRFNSKSEYASILHTKVFNEDIDSTHITKKPELMYDTTAWNKIFKKEFWDKNKLNFPEGILYEDIPVTIPAHFLSRKTSIITEVVYYWRERDGITKSITQERTDITNFTDRLYGLKVVDKFIEENIKDEKCIYTKYFKWLDLDLKLYINKLDQVDDEYIKVFLDTVLDYLESIPKEIFNDLRAIDRIKYHCIKNRDINLLCSVLKYEKNEFKYVKVSRIKDKYIADFPFENVPKEYFDMTKEFNNCKLTRCIETINYEKGKMILKGYFYIPRVSVSSKNLRKISAKLINMDNNKSMNIEIINCFVKGLTQRVGIRLNDFKLRNRLYNYDWAGFKIEIDLNNKQLLNLGDGNYKIEIDFSLPGINRKFFIGGPKAGKSARPKNYLNFYNKYMIRYSSGWDLLINSKEQKAGINKVFEENGDIKFKGWFADSNSITDILVIEWNKNKKVNLKTININNNLEKVILEKYTNATNFEFTITKEELLNNFGSGEWFLNYYKDGKREVITANDVANKKMIIGDFKVEFDISLSGALIIKSSTINVYTNNIQVDNKKIKMIVYKRKNHIDNLNDVSLKLSSKKYLIEYVEIPKEISYKENFVEYTFEINTKKENRENKFQASNWDIVLESKNGNNKESRKIDYMINEKLKVNTINTHKYKFLSNKNGKVSLNVKLAWGILDKGPRRREALERYIYPLFRLLPIKKNRVLFESYWGNKYNCNPRYLYEYLYNNYPEYEYIWSMSDESLDINGNSKKVRIGSLKYLYYMATSKYFVNNVNFPDFYVKRDKAIEIQTMHGTPLKTLGLDVPDEFKTEEGKNKFIKRCKRWDYLIVSSDKVEEITRRCFAYKNKVLKVGYPRIDKIFDINNQRVKREVREKLNISKEKKVILYAPTWRVKNKFDMKLDLKKMKEELGDKYVLLLKVHPFSAKGLNEKILNDFVIDVTNYSDIESLYILSDVIITDYSSVMFDYAVLDKPMLFFTYDLQLYKNNLRGFNLNFEEEAPGPLLHSSDDVIENLKNLNKVKQKYYNKYYKFKKKYCQYETGNSCKQIFEAVFK